jgi:flagellar basal body rod protein FlgB
MRMSLSSLVTDNITELLVKRVEFTQVRQKVLSQNINSLHNFGYVPKDLAVDEFSELLSEAVEEHIRCRRLLLRDSENIKFGVSGSFKARAVVDEHARELLEIGRDQYLELQMNKLLENSLNQRVAAELLRQKQGMLSVFE